VPLPRRESKQTYKGEAGMNELVHRAGNGDEKAREELLMRLTPRLEKIVRRYEWVHGIERDDLKQEAYMAVIEGLDRVDINIGSSSEYLLKFARWRLLDCLKKILRKKQRELERMATFVPSDADLTAELELLDRRLTPVQKSILKYLAEGYTWREIGEKMGFTAANVSHHLKQIRKLYGVS
jgi:RNA polymerase sigma factor (sigma-70 family)